MHGAGQAGARRRAIVFLVLMLALLAPQAGGERTRFWRQSSFEEFEKGTAKGVALRSDGKLMLAPRFAPFADPNVAYLWALRTDSRGNLYAAGGSNAKVVRFNAAGESKVVFEAQEMAAQALVVDRQDNLYVGTSPDGKVYKITPGGQQSIFFEPKTKYIWDLALGTDGTLYVATGDKGEVFAVTPEGKGSRYFQSEETHIRSLVADARGNLILGTEPNGWIVRLEKPAGKSSAPPEVRAFVLYETNRKEVTALCADRAGNLYAAAVGQKSRQPAAPLPTGPLPAAQTQSPQLAAALAAAQAQPQVQQQPPITAFVPFPAVTGGSEVYRIAPDGSPELLWSSREELVYSLGLSPAGKLLLGTGNRGLVVQLETAKVFSNLAKTASAQVTSLVAAADGKVYVATANPGKVFALGPDHEPEGSFESQTFDAKVFSQWGRISWWGENGSTDGQVSLYVRSGNTSNPEKSWSPWAGPYTAAQGETVNVPPARFLQWKAVFRGKAGGDGQPGETPNLAWVSLAYLPKNVAPSVDAIVLQNPGIRVQSLATPQQPGAQTAPLRLPAAGGATGFGAGLQPSAPSSRRSEPPPQGLLQKGYQSLLWSAQDDNDDELVYSLYYRGEGEQNWKLLKDRIEQKFFGWDTTTMPDGAYYLKLVASDAPSNPPEEALTAEQVSDRFEVDNTPPEITGLAVTAAGAEARARFVARDTASALARAEYSLDAGEWRLLLPAGRVTDAREENYELVLRDLAPGEHTLAVRIYDLFDNSTTGKATFTVEPPKKR